MTPIKIKSEIGTANALLLRFGVTILEKAENILSKGDTVLLDFEGMNMISTSFFHVTVGCLYQKLGNDFDAKVKTVNMMKEDWQLNYGDAIYRVQHPEINAAYREAVLELFED